MHRSRILKRAFSVAHQRAAAERKDLPGYRRCIRRGLRGRNAASAENRRASQKAGVILELGVLHARQIGNSEKPSAQTSSLISTASAWLHRDVGSASISNKLLPQSGIAQQIGDSMSQLSRRIDLDCSAANSKLSGRGCAPKDRSQKRLPSSHALWHRSPNDQ
jgi:hypothetical protein